MSAPSLSTFDLDLHFDPALVSVSNTRFGSSSASFDQLNISGVGAITQANQPSPGDLHLIEVSLDSPNVLDNRQPGSFALAEISLRGLQPGSTGLVPRRQHARRLARQSALPIEHYRREPLGYSRQCYARAAQLCAILFWRELASLFYPAPEAYLELLE